MPIAVTMPMAWWLKTSSARLSPLRPARTTAPAASPAESTPIAQASQVVRTRPITLLSGRGGPAAGAQHPRPPSRDRYGPAPPAG